MKRNSEQMEAACFLLEQPSDKDRELHFHGGPEIYVVVKGKAFVMVCGDKRLLTQGQMVVVNPYENHLCEAEPQAEMLVVRVGDDYLGRFASIYPDKKLPRWLTDEKCNHAICDYMQRNFSQAPDADAQQKTEIACQLFSMIAQGYDLVEQKEISIRDQMLIAEIVQYIYEHCSEKLTLEVLSKKFYLSPTFLSKKLRKQICVDLRVFVNDIRLIRVMQMIDAPENEGRRLEDIAFACGFSSMSTFYRCCKRSYRFRKSQSAHQIPQE